MAGIENTKTTEDKSDVSLQSRLAGLPDECRSVIMYYDAKVEACEKQINQLCELFDNGHANVGGRFLDLGNIPSCVQAVTAAFSHASMLWGDIRGKSNSSETRRKFMDSYSFGKVKSFAKQKSESNGKTADKDGLKLTQKDVESIVVQKNETYYILEREWNMLYARIGACKEILETYLKSLDLIWKSGRTEWSSTR